MNKTQPWWQQSTVYQIYPRSFCDSNGDGIGDIMNSRQRMTSTFEFASPDRLPVIYHSSEAGLYVHGRKLLDLFCRFPPDARWTKKNDEKHYGYKNHVKAAAKSKLIEPYAVTDASVHDSQMLEPLLDGTAGAVYADSAYRSAEAEALLAGKQITSQVHECAYRNHPLTDAQQETNRPKSKVRARIEQVLGAMSQTMQGFDLRYIGQRRNAAAIGFINLIDNLARYEQIVRLPLIPLRAA